MFQNSPQQQSPVSSTAKWLYKNVYSHKWYHDMVFIRAYVLFNYFYTISLYFMLPRW